MQKDWRRHNLRLERFEKGISPKKYKVVAGVDEAGRGPLAGPVVACAVILKKRQFTVKIFDSKKLSLSARQRAYAQIMKRAYIGVGIVDNKIIDKKNILQATIIAIQKALDNLAVEPNYLLVDGRFRPGSFNCVSRNVIGGDNRCFSIACASIVAKVTRDRLMSYYSALYPQYGFQRNHGYYTQEHLRAIKKHGITPIHRRSFRPLCFSEA